MGLFTILLVLERVDDVPVEHRANLGVLAFIVLGAVAEAFRSDLAVQERRAEFVRAAEVEPIDARALARRALL